METERKFHEHGSEGSNGIEKRVVDDPAQLLCVSVVFVHEARCISLEFWRIEETWHKAGMNQKTEINLFVGVFRI